MKAFVISKSHSEFKKKKSCHPTSAAKLRGGTRMLLTLAPLEMHWMLYYPLADVSGVGLLRFVPAQIWQPDVNHTLYKLIRHLHG